MTPDLIVEVASVLPVVLVTAVLCRWALSLHVVTQVVFKDTGERHGRQHAHHRSQSQHQTHHHAGKIHSADGIQSHWWRESRERDKEVTGDQDVIIPAWWVWFNLKSNITNLIYFNLMLSSHIKMCTVSLLCCHLDVMHYFPEWLQCHCFRQISVAGRHGIKQRKGTRGCINVFSLTEI